MTERFDLCVIGAGSGGLSVAAGAAQMGARVVLFEADRMGGDCLNTGCVPSKALIAAARAAHGFRAAGVFGIRPMEPEVDFAAVRDHVRGVIAAIAPNDSQERFEGLGVTVVRAHARFVDRDAVEAGGRRFTARRFVLATGSRPARPPVPGLAETPHLTNETVFDLDRRPEHLIVIGAGPIGCELSQAFRRLGSRVTLVEREAFLGADDHELAGVVRSALLAEGVELHEGVEVRRVEGDDAGVRVRIGAGAGSRLVAGDRLLVAAGRSPAVDDLGLPSAGIVASARGVVVDARLRTSNPRVFAIGDCREGPQFTHLAGYEAGVVIQNALLRLPAKVDLRALPRVTYTDPEIAQVGLTEAEARERFGQVQVLRWPFHDNDRAQAERRTEGLVKAYVSRGRVLGAAIVGDHAGELIHAWGQAIAQRRPLRSLTSGIVAYPTLSEASRRAASSAFTAALFGPGMRRLVRVLATLP